jgi:Tfp pilus assembly protein PilF
MRGYLTGSVVLAGALLFATTGVAQTSDDICREYGEVPTRDAGSARAVPYVFGRVRLKGVSANAKTPQVTVIYSDNNQPAIRQNIGRSGNYCFRRIGNGGMIIVEVDGNETVRRSISDLAATRHQEDFEVAPPHPQETAAPGVVSAKFYRPPNEKTAPLYRKAAEAEAGSDMKMAIEAVRAILTIDREDFIAWSKLGSLYLAQDALKEAELCFRRALEYRGDYTPALVNLGVVAAVQKYYPAAIALFLEAIKTEPRSARAYRLLGEAYLHNKQGALGLAALDKALEIDPVGMAECHLLKARLYDLAGATNLAAGEYRAFLAKVPDHPDKAKFEKYINNQPLK